MLRHGCFKHITDSMVGVVQPKTACKPDLLPGQWREQRLYVKYVLRKLRSRVERRPQNLMGQNLFIVHDS